MSQGQGKDTVDISKLIDDRGLSSIHIILLLWSMFIVIIDGYDIAAISFAAPHLVKAWNIADRGALGPVFSASLVGILFGSAIFGFVGDRYGRKRALMGSLLVFGVFTWLAAYSNTLNQMFWLRLLAGLGIGGVIPNVIAMNIEFAPRHLRSTLTIIAMAMVMVGGVIAGLISTTLVAKYGWQIIFLVGGIGPILIAGAIWLALPESIKFMAIHEGYRGDLEKLIKRLRPDMQISADAHFIIEEEKQYAGFNPKHLFDNGLTFITPLLWLLFALNLMGYYFLLSWTPLLLTAAKLPMATAALAGTALLIGGTVGSLAICRLIDKYGFKPVTILFAVAVPIVASIGYVGLAGSQAGLLITTFFAGFCVLGIQSAINAAGALIYPTSLRANGSGWQLGIGRVGSIVGPLLGGLFVLLPVQQIYMWSAVPFLIGAVVCYAISLMNEARLGKQAESLQRAIA